MATRRQTIIRRYRGTKQSTHAAFVSDADRMSKDNYFPVSANYYEGAWGCGSFLFATILCFILVGILVFIYMLIVKPDGTLTVVYEYNAADRSVLIEEKQCPQCAETVRGAARVCRFCGHEFV